MGLVRSLLPTIEGIYLELNSFAIPCFYLVWFEFSFMCLY